ncbi:MAG: hypothetical protein IIT48_06030 [Lachnospiraceae bacterium]|nr:hypothetical protein [Lachnospiraceae bacterium]
MKKYINEISKNKNLESNLPIYASYMMDLYNKRAGVEFAMDYYTFQGMISDNVTKDDYLLKYTKEFNDIIANYVLNIIVDDGREQAIAKIDSLRNNVYNVVEVLTCYADIFARYEYVINRCEYLFNEIKTNSKYTDEDFTREVMQYIFSEEDNAVVNSRICEIISELPLRMTKNKFFELLDGGMSVYKDTDKITIDDFIYSVETSAMLKIPENMEHYTELFEIYNEIKAIDYKNITEKEYRDTAEKLNFAADYIERATDIFMILQGLINKAYVMVIAAPYVDTEDKEVKNSVDIIRNINENFYNDEFITLEEKITDNFIFLEGVPEKIQNIIQSAEYVLDDVKKDKLDIVKNIMADKIYLGLFLCEKLLSDSLFINLSAEYNIFEEKTVDKNDETDITEYLREKQDKLITELTEFFNSNQKIVNKSVMSLVLSKLPVFFNNITEVQDYIYNSLNNCTNKAEKAACIEIINGLMEN